MNTARWSFPRLMSSAGYALTAVLCLLPSVGYAQSIAKTTEKNESEEPEDDAVILSAFTVTSSRDVGYRSTQTISGSRTIENLRNTPNSISILNRELIDDLAAGSITELLSHSIAGEMGAQSQAPTPGQAANATNPFYEFRGLVSQYPLRDGILWPAPNDSYNIERVEILRGPNAFLYGESGASGSMNQISKRPVLKNFTRTLVRIGSDGFLRGELDINRKLTDKIAIRLNAAEHTQESPMHHVGRDFSGVTLATVLRPFPSTTIFANLEVGRSEQKLQAGILGDGYSLTDDRDWLGPVRNSDQTAGLTYLPASGLFINTIGQRLSTGTSVALPVVPSQFISNAEAVFPRKSNYLGPDSYFDVRYDSVMVDIEQRIGSNLTLQGSFSQFNMIRDSLYANGTLAGGIFRDLAQTLPDGSQNPYYNELYTEYYFARRYLDSSRRMARLSAVYNLELPFTTQKIVAQATYNDNTLEGKWYSEFVDPSNPNFVGTLVPETTKAQADANTQVWRRNHFYRRHYLKDGDSARYTAFNTVPGVSTFMRTGLDSETDGDSGRFFSSDYQFYLPGYGIGSSGTYWGGKVNSLIGWRRDYFYSRRTPDYYNATLGGDVPVNPAAGRQTVVARVSEDSYNYGIVVHPASFLSLYANYAESVSISASPIGSPAFKTGELRELGQGAGTEYGLRWSFLDGRLESNWTIYETSNVKTFGSPHPSAGVQAEIASIFGSQFNSSGSDTHDETATGLEFETVANVTKNWRLTWNVSTNKLALTNRFPALKYFQSEADARGEDTPLLDAHLAAAPDGTPRFGYTKLRSNLISNYTFTSGPLKNLSVGGSIQYRDRSYMGRLDLDVDGILEDEYSPGYTLYNLFLGYTTKLWKQEVRYQLNIQNLFNKSYFRTYGPGAGAFGEGMTWRFTVRTEF